MNLLLIHQNFPGQFRHLANDLVRHDEHRVLAIGRDTAPGLPGVRLLRYRPNRESAKQTHAYLQSFENAVLHGQQVARLLQRLRGQGYRPDAILAHPGWGETLFAKEIFPKVPLIHFCEYYYHSQGADAGFDPEFPLSLEDVARIRMRNSLHLLNLEHCDLGIAPTHWQHSLHPLAYRNKIRVAHEGIPLEALGPDEQASLTLPDGRILRAGQPIVTYVSRSLEPYRGFHSFMRALPAILSGNSKAEVLLIGGDQTGYGRGPSDASNWRTKLLSEVTIDPQRVHFLGKVPYETYRKVLQISAAHVYLTYPFVLSWSMLEAMACGCLVIGSDTAPVREVIRHGQNGYLVDFFAPDVIASRVLEVLASPNRQYEQRMAAQATARSYSVGNGLRAYRQLLNDALEARHTLAY